MVYDNLDFGRGVEAFLAGIPATSVDALNVGLSEVASAAERGYRHHRRPGGCPRAVPHPELDRRLRLVLRRPQRRARSWCRCRRACWASSTTPTSASSPTSAPPDPTAARVASIFLCRRAIPAHLPSEGYFVQHPRTYINLFIVRAFVQGGDVAATVQNIKDSAPASIRCRQPLTHPSTTFVNISGRAVQHRARQRLSVL